MEFIAIAERIKCKYEQAGQNALADEVNDCLTQGGTIGERFLILAQWLKKLREVNIDQYRIAYEESELIIRGSSEYFARAL